MYTLFKKSVEVLPLFFALGGIQALLRGFIPVGDGASLHNTHVLNAVCPLSLKILYHKVPLISPLLH